MKKQIGWLVFLLLATTASVHAEGVGTETGNGGGGEVEFAALRAEIGSWIHQRLADGSLEQKLNLATVGLTAEAFTSLYAHYESTPVIFQDDPIKITGYSSLPSGRICGNQTTPAQIVCQISPWNKASPQIRFAIVLHEILGVAGLEGNQGQYSQYPVSSRLLRYLHRSERYELGVEGNLALHLRERFAAAQTATYEQLMNQQFTCESYLATLPPDHPVVGHNQPRPWNFLISAKTPNRELRYEEIGHSSRLDGLVLDPRWNTDWVGAKPAEMPGMTVYFAVRRENTTGKFIAEYSVLNPELQYGIPYLRPIIGWHYNVRVWDYLICDAHPITQP